MLDLWHIPKITLYLYAYFTLEKIVQPFSQPFILIEIQKETG